MIILEIIRDIVIIACLIGGTFFYTVGVIGLIRMPDVFCRMHATTKCDTMGTGLIFVGLILWQGVSFIALNILVILIFIWLTNPTAAHAIAQSAYRHEIRKQEGDNKDGNT